VQGSRRGIEEQLGETDPLEGTYRIRHRGLGAQGAVDDDQQAVDRMQEAVDEAAAIAEATGGLGRPGRPMNKRSPFFVGMSAAAGVAVTYGLVELVIRARAVLVLIGLAMFIAAGLEPAVSWLTRHRFPRWAAVTTILLIAVGIFAGFLAAAIPPLTSQYLNLTKNSTLAVAIGYPDLVQVFTGTVLNQTGQAVEVVAITMLVYLTISLVTSLLMNLYNRRVALVER